jgi:sulfite dehydrogenase (quinone) subunit SoeC
MRLQKISFAGTMKRHPSRRTKMTATPFEKWSALWQKFTQKRQQPEYEWMIEPTQQEEWIEGQGAYLWLAFFFSEIGAGIYFVSLFIDFSAGLILGYLMALGLGGWLHMRYLGNPMRGWRILTKYKTSELARGMWIIMAFAVLGFFQILPSIFPALPWTGFNVLFKIITGVVCIMIIMHGFATMNVIRSLPSWSSTMILPLSIISGIWVGSQFVQLFYTPYAADPNAFEVWSRVFFFVYLCFVVLFVWGTYHVSNTARFSMEELLKGNYSQIFYAGVVGIGLAVPLLLTLIMWAEVNLFLLFLRLVFVLVGDMLLRLTIMKSGYYTPLI